MDVLKTLCFRGISNLTYAQVNEGKKGVVNPLLRFGVVLQKKLARGITHKFPSLFALGL